MAVDQKIIDSLVQQILATSDSSKWTGEGFGSAESNAKDMAKIRQAISAIQKDETMTGAQKKEEIDRMKLLIGIIAEQLESVRRSMKQ